MNAKANLYAVPVEASAGAVPEVETKGVTMVVCAALAAVSFAAPLLIALSQTLDAVASPGPTIREIVIASETPATFHQQYPVQAAVDWVDTLAETSLGQWYARASD